ncbi:MAG: glycosyltransferase [Phormidesmis sp.]
MKVIHLITGLDTGGAETMLYKLLSARPPDQGENAYQPVVISLMDKGTLGPQIESLGVPVYTVNMEQGKPTIQALYKLIRYVRKLQPDLIQGWMYHGNLASQIASIAPFKSVLTLWNIRNCVYTLADEKPGTAKVITLSARLSRLPASIIYNSKTSVVQHEALGYTPDKTVVIPNGFNTESLRPSPAAYRSVRDELNLESETRLIGRIGRYHAIKDHATFLQAAKQLLAQWPDVHFVMAGPGVDWDNLALVEQIRRLEMSDRIHLLGDRRDIPRLTAALDISCSSSSHGEAFPNVIGEAMSCCVPCVVTDVGDSAWIVGETGKVVPPAQPTALAQALQDLLEAGPVSRRRLGETARQTVIDLFSLDAIAAQYLNLYRQVINKPALGIAR